VDLLPPTHMYILCLTQHFLHLYLHYLEQGELRRTLETVNLGRAGITFA
jgi:hypothetical protein